MLQQVVVVLLVATAALFSAWKLMPARRRLQMLLALDRWSSARPALASWRQRWLKPRIVRAAGVGCDGCAANDSTPRRPR